MPKTTDNTRLTREQIFRLLPTGKQTREGKLYCPLCEEWHLTITPQTGAPHCFTTGCGDKPVAWFWKKLEAEPGKPPKENKPKPTGDGMTLAEYADWKKLPADWLRKYFYLEDGSHPYYKQLKCAVKFPYYRPSPHAADPRGELTAINWRWGMGKGERKFQSKDRQFLYGGRFLDWMLKAKPEDRGTLPYLFLVEGESNTQTLCKAGYPAIGVPGAPNGWKAEYAEFECFNLAKTLYVLQDLDPDGNPDPASVALLKKVAASFPSGKVRGVRLRRGTKDVSDLWIESEAERTTGAPWLTEESLFERDLNLAVQEAAPVDPPISPTVATVEDPTPHLVPFPADIGAEVFDACPILKAFVDRVLPEVEADANILTADFLAFAGAIVGRRVLRYIVNDPHTPATFHLSIADTGIGKGTALNAAEAVFRPVDPKWYDILRGSARSGQALVRLLKNVSEEMTEYKGKNGEREYRDNQQYTGGRVLLSFAEAADLFGSMKIKDSVLSPYLRKAYDGKPQSNEVGDADKSIAPFYEPYTLAVLGTITPWELRQYLGAAEFANGLVNRFVWWASKPTKRVPRPRTPDLSDLSARLRALIPPNAPKNPVLLDFSADAGRAWDTWYAELPHGDGTPLATACARIPANALRLALLFAVLDESRLTLQGTPLEIGAHHVRAAAAIMERHRASVAWYLSQTPAAATATGDGERKIARVRDLATVNRGRFTGAQLYRLFSHGTQAERESIAVAAGFVKEPGATEKGHAIAVWVPARTPARENGQKGGQHA